jgi:hypothetical protein
LMIDTLRLLDRQRRFISHWCMLRDCVVQSKSAS